MDFQEARHNMVAGQLRPNRITDPYVLQAFAEIPRELFVSLQHRNVAYQDVSVSQGYGHDLPPPLVLAHMLQSLGLQPGQNCLVISGGSGYSTALVASVVRNTVYMTEDDKLLRARARNSFMDCNIDNVEVIQAVTEKGHAEAAPYDRIIIDVPVGSIPQKLLDQLTPEGRLVCLMPGKDGLADIVLHQRSGGLDTVETVMDVPVPLPAALRESAAFSF